ncbi:MAG: alginate export family protein, partial [Bacteroidota bacterium]|nr:alginate export family protein [Bacteroidota bacterium]
MNISSILKTILLITFLLPTWLFAQNEFEVNGVYRPRFEFRDGYKSLKEEGAKPAAFVSQRARLSFDYKNEKIETRFTFFDYRVWGDQFWKKDIASVGVHEVWAAIKLSESAKLTLGRQSFQYDNGRLVSAVNWNQVGAAHDAARFRFSKDGFELEALTAWNQNKENTTGTDYIFDGETNSLYYKNLNILWLSKKINNTQISSMTLLDGNEEVDITDTVTSNNPNNLNYRYTTGLILKHKAGNFATVARAFYQGGKLYTGTDVNAYYLNIETSYKLSKNTKLLLGCELMSGDDKTDTTNTTSNAFDILYGARHKFNGRIDYFNVPSTTKSAGLVNPYAWFEYSFSKSSKITAEYHVFFLQNNFIPENEIVAIDKYLGHEVDLTYSKKYNDFMSLT